VRDRSAGGSRDGGDPDPEAHGEPVEPPLEPLARGVREARGAEDFRAVAPPVMSFTQGRRR
jgi:hypothetical protein